MKHEIQILSQIVDEMEVAVERLERAFNRKKREELAKEKKTLLELHRKLKEELMRKR